MGRESGNYRTTEDKIALLFNASNIIKINGKPVVSVDENDQMDADWV